MAKGDKIHLFNDDFINDDEEQLAMRNKMIKEFGLNGYNVITKLMEKLDKRKASLDAQEDLLILEKERNLELQELLSNKDEMLEVLTKEISVVKITIEDKEKEISNVRTSIVNLANEKGALESSLLSLTVQNQELQVQLESCKNFNTSSLVAKSKASSSNNNICKHCTKYHTSCCLTNHARKESSLVKVKEILKKCSSNDGLKKVEPKYKFLKPNNGRKGLGYNSYKVNPSIEHKGWRSPKFIERTTLYDALGSIHSPNDK
jgi:chromosome segregation ATPase